MNHFGIDPSLQGNTLSKLLMKVSLEFPKSINCRVKHEAARANHGATNRCKKAGFTYPGDYEINTIIDGTLISNDQI